MAISRLVHLAHTHVGVEGNHPALAALQTGLDRRQAGLAVQRVQRLQFDSLDPGHDSVVAFGQQQP